MFVVLSGVVLLAAIGAAVARWQARTADLFERAALCLALGILIDFWMMLTGQPIGRVLAVGAALGVAGIWQVAVTQRRSDLQDMDIAAGLSQLQNGQVGLQAALQSYATLGRTSLFELLR